MLVGAGRLERVRVLGARGDVVVVSLEVRVVALVLAVGLEDAEPLPS